MIERISIENFRCFQKTTIQGFKLINLIGGKNNSGKTCFLEAIYFAENPRWIEKITSSRYSNLSEEDKKSSIYYNYDIYNNININILYEGNISENVRYSETSSPLIYQFETVSEIAFKKRNDFTKLIFSKNLQLPELLHLSNEFDKADIKGESGVILEMLRLIDGNIDEIKTYSSKPYVLYLRKKGEKNFMPLHDFGDAFQKVMRYIITIMTFEKGGKQNYLLIDEIENGLHYTAHYEFWLMLFKLAKAYNIQIFATSHSLEMIRAFNEVAMQEGFAGDAMYFEMSRHFKTQNIIANPMDMDMLHYELVTQNPFRGE